MKLLELISRDLNVPEHMLTTALTLSRRLVKHIKIPKRDGTYRRAYQPSRQLKIVQYWLQNNVFGGLRIHPAAMAYRKFTSTRINASTHQSGQYFVKLDFKDFFPSIRFHDLSPHLKGWHKHAHPEFTASDMLEIVRSACFYQDDRLPIGYPTSPLLSNVVMYDFDSTLTTLLGERDKYGIAKYTRYADDLTISTDKRGASDSLITLVETQLSSMKSPALKLNTSKTRRVSACAGSAFITGLRICHDGHITIHRNYKDKIRLLVSLYKKGTLSDEDTLSLKGHLSYIRHVDSRFYTKLQRKYFRDLAKLTSSQEESV